MNEPAKDLKGINQIPSLSLKTNFHEERGNKVS